MIGQRYIDEIELACMKLPVIKEAVVVEREDGSGERKLVIYFVATSGLRVNVELMRQMLRQYVSIAMEALVFVQVVHFSYTVSGEIDREALENIPVDLAFPQISTVKKPFFFVRGSWFGGPFYHFKLARLCGNEQTFYVLGPVQSDDEEREWTLEALAAEQIEAMRAIQSEGPYLLGGFHYGGLIAYEMTRQLLVAGQDVELLLLVAPVSAGKRDKRLRKGIDMVGKMLQLTRAQRCEMFLRLRRVGGFSRVGEDEWMAWLAADYERRCYSGHITFIWPEEEQSERKAWWYVEKKSESKVVPGTQIGCVTEHIELLAKQMKKYLDEAQEEA